MYYVLINERFQIICVLYSRIPSFEYTRQVLISLKFHNTLLSIYNVRYGVLTAVWLIKTYIHKQETLWMSLNTVCKFWTLWKLASKTNDKTTDLRHNHLFWQHHSRLQPHFIHASRKTFDRFKMLHYSLTGSTYINNKTIY
jgi:hypothetical protein